MALRVPSGRDYCKRRGVRVTHVFFFVESLNKGRESLAKMKSDKTMAHTSYVSLLIDPEEIIWMLNPMRISGLAVLPHGLDNMSIFGEDNCAL